MASKPSTKRPQTASLKLGLTTVGYQTPRNDNSAGVQTTTSSNQPSEFRHTRSSSSTLFLDKKAALLSVFSSPDNLKVTHLSDESHKKMMYNLYGSPKEKRSSIKFTLNPQTTDYAYENLNKEEQGFFQKKYEAYKKNYDRMVFDKDKNLIYYHPKRKGSLDPSALTDHATRAKISEQVESTQKKVQKVNAENVLKKAQELSKQVTARSPRAFIDILRNRKLEVLDHELKASKLEAVVQHTTREMNDLAHKAGELIDNVEVENKNLKDANSSLEQQIDELRAENVILKRTNHLLQQQIVADAEDKEDLQLKSRQLEFFMPTYEALKARFPGEDYKNIGKKFDQLERCCYENIMRINELEEEKTLIKSEGKKQDELMKEKDTRIKNEQDERNKLINLYRNEIDSMESELTNRRNYEKDYKILSNKVVDIFVGWSSKLKIYFSYDKMPEINAKCRDPLEILDIMQRMVKIATPDSMQGYLRKIIVSANQLRRKYFPEDVNSKYDPDKIYDLCSKHIENLEMQIKRLKGANLSDGNGKKT